MNKIYIVIYGLVLIGEYNEDLNREISKIAWKDKELANEFAKNKYEELKKIVDKPFEIATEEFGNYSSFFENIYGDMHNEVYAYIQEIEVK